MRALLDAGADVNVPDKESGWTPLHRALYWGNLRAAVMLMNHGASIVATDWQGRIATDLISAELKDVLVHSEATVTHGDVFSWGSGTNYALGTGCTDVALGPCRIETLHGERVVALAAGKFHSAAVTADGRLMTWGWGHGGRLGHPEAHIHCGESAVIAPRIVSVLERKVVTSIAVAKHHTLLCTSNGECYSMGSNRYGQLGVAGIDTQPLPKKIANLRGRFIISVAAANKHSAAVSSSGDVFTWGANTLGQLGYGTSDSITNVTPRLVEAMKGRTVLAVAAAKRHTLVLTTEGEVLTWGHRGVSPRRVPLTTARNAYSLNGQLMSFHRGREDVIRPVVVAIAAGAAHSSALTVGGIVLTWRSADPNLMVQEVSGNLAGKRAVSISAGKYRTAVVTDEGDVYMWEGRSDFFPAEGRRPGSGSKKPSSSIKGRPILRPPMPPNNSVVSFQDHSLAHGGSLGCYSSPKGVSWGDTQQSHGSIGSRRSGGSLLLEKFAAERRTGGASPEGCVDSLPGTVHEMPDTFEKIVSYRVEGLKRAAAVAVGEKHTLAIQAWGVRSSLEAFANVPWWAALTPSKKHSKEGEDVSEDDEDTKPVSVHADRLGPPTLQEIAEASVAKYLVDPRTALSVLEYADVAGTQQLKAYCLAVTSSNLDAVLTEVRPCLMSLSSQLLEELERLYKAQLSGSTAMPNQNLVQSCERSTHGDNRRDISEGGIFSPGRRPTASSCEEGRVLQRESSQVTLSMSSDGAFQTKNADETHKLARSLHKKLQQIAHLEGKMASGAALDHQQQAKVASKPVYAAALISLEGGMLPADVLTVLRAASRLGVEEQPMAKDSLAKKAKHVPQSEEEAVERPKTSPEASTSSKQVNLETAPASVMANPVCSPVPERHYGFHTQLGERDSAVRGSPTAKRGLNMAAPRKGGLSMFLRGELEASTRAAEAEQPLTPWKDSSQPSPSQTSAVSLHDILSKEEDKLRQNSRSVSSNSRKSLSATKSRTVGAGVASVKMSLADFMSAAVAPPGHQEPPPPVWGGAAGASPPAAIFSLRTIQQEQAALKSKASAASPPMMRRGPVNGSSPSATSSVLLGTSPVGRMMFTAAPVPPSKWYVPDEGKAAAKPFLVIQSEECARKDMGKPTESRTSSGLDGAPKF